MNRYWSNGISFRGMAAAIGFAAGLGVALPAIASPDATPPQAYSAAKHKVSDSRITADVQKLLAERIPARYKVDVKTTEGVVILKGDLKDRAMTERVRNMVAQVDGVKSVNMLAVDYPFIVMDY